MSGWRIDLGRPAVLAFRGPDALRFLNGQLTQDARRVMAGGISLPACVTDAKGRLQFRVHLWSPGADELRVVAEEGLASELEARLTRYLIADEVEVEDQSGAWRGWHFTDRAALPPEIAGRVLASGRFGTEGADLWLPADEEPGEIEALPLLDGEDFEHWRISRGLPLAGREIVPGMLPPEAGLDASDISYAKGCYIGQEVISRIRSAGKVNRRLRRLSLDAAAAARPGDSMHEGEREAGELTSLSPRAEDGRRLALGYVRRGRDESRLCWRDPEGREWPLRVEPA